PSFALSGTVRGAERQAHGEDAAAAVARVRAQLATLFVHDGPRDREAQAGAFALGLAGHEGLEDVLEIFSRNSAATIAHLDDEITGLAAYLDLDVRLARAGIDRIAHQVDQHVPQLAAIEPRRCGRALEAQLQRHV